MAVAPQRGEYWGIETHQHIAFAPHPSAQILTLRRSKNVQLHSVETQKSRRFKYWWSNPIYIYV